jgi:hypothetical protein
MRGMGLRGTVRVEHRGRLRRREEVLGHRPSDGSWVRDYAVCLSVGVVNLRLRCVCLSTAFLLVRGRGLRRVLSA